MKKNILFFALMMLFSSTCISTSAKNPDNDPMPITGAPNIPIRKSPHISYILIVWITMCIHSFFMRPFNNVEIKINQNGILINQNHIFFAKDHL